VHGCGDRFVNLGAYSPLPATGADVRVDIDHLTHEQVLGLAQHYFADPAYSHS
jgi:hypothetical protein